MNIDGRTPAAAAPSLVQKQTTPDIALGHRKTDGEISECDAARSAENIRIWRSYLRKDCVDTMIEMGWDFSV